MWRSRSTLSFFWTVLSSTLHFPVLLGVNALCAVFHTEVHGLGRSRCVSASSPLLFTSRAAHLIWQNPCLFPGAELLPPVSRHRTDLDMILFIIQEVQEGEIALVRLTTLYLSPELDLTSPPTGACADNEPSARSSKTWGSSASNYVWFPRRELRHRRAPSARLSSAREGHGPDLSARRSRHHFFGLLRFLPNMMSWPVAVASRGSAEKSCEN